MIYQPDTEALQKLIDRFYDDGPLNKFLDGLERPVREAAKQALMQGFLKGDGAGAIAKGLDEVTGIGRDRAMAIVQTETNRAHKAASLDFYQEAGIKKYVWMAVLDPRTCGICWSRHGQIYDAGAGPTQHDACRCTVIARLDDGEVVETGEERFAKLEPGYQKQILGPKRFELYKSGQTLMAIFKNKSTESEIDYLNEFDNCFCE